MSSITTVRQQATHFDGAGGLAPTWEEGTQTLDYAPQAVPSVTLCCLDWDDAGCFDEEVTRRLAVPA